MDFNTGCGSGRPPSNGGGNSSSSLFGGERPTPGPGGGSGTEFTLSNPVGSFVSTTVNVLTQPTSFFRNMARQEDFINPALYAMICSLISAVLGGLALAALFSSVADLQGTFGTGVFGLVVDVVLSPLVTVIILFVLAGIYHLLVLLLVRPTNAGFEATFRVIGYVSAISLLGWIPIINIIVGIFGLYIAYFGIREVHGTTNQRAAAVVALPTLTGIFFIIVVTGVAIVLRAS